MRRLTVFETRNGWLVIDGDSPNAGDYERKIRDSNSFNSLDKAIAHLRRVMKSWHQISPSGANIAADGAGVSVSNSLSTSEGCCPKNKAGLTSEIPL